MRDARRQHAHRGHPLGLAALEEARFELAGAHLDGALELVDHGGARLGEHAGGALSAGGELVLQQFLLVAAVLVFELLRRIWARTRAVRTSGPLDLEM